ncbi:MAG: sugar kinase [Deltaproteobacteria bacterium]|nr:sugar kinase [Deltaproteobacteria bacterium]MBI3293959.1 sugar kinase [Deltaproteobacteria bacterium]
MAPIVCIGSMAFDSIETPFGKAGKVLGGSANYFSLAASYFTSVRCVSIVGEDYPKEHLELLQNRGVDISGVKLEQGKTFHWAGRYSYDMNTAHTLETCLNVLEKFEANVPAHFQDSEFVFLGNSTPALQMKLLSQIKRPKFIAIDTMNLWIENSRDALIEAISKCHALIINEAEVRQLTQVYNLVQAAKAVRSWGPQILVVKRGEYGAVLFDHGEPFSAPGLPLAEVKDPTGAGDSFAGGFMGYLASAGHYSLSRYELRKAVIYGCVMASHTVQDFGFAELVNVKKDQIQGRYDRFVDLTRFHVE